MRQVIAGNWKMFGRLEDVAGYAAALQGAAPECDIVVCPPATLLPAFAAALAGTGIGLGGQNCHFAVQGAHTGDIAAAMLADAGASHVILGHSERRADHGETDLIVGAKIAGAVAAGLVPIVCVGETWAHRDAGAALQVVVSQLTQCLPDGFAGIVAYEPIWAIGTGRTPTPDDITAMHAAIRTALIARLGAGGRAIAILYGGSVKPENAAAILALPEVGGALVGGASLKSADFLAIAAQARAP
jgi:triosephosphate isomerase